MFEFIWCMFVLYKELAVVVAIVSAVNVLCARCKNDMWDR